MRREARAAVAPQRDALVRRAAVAGRSLAPCDAIERSAAADRPDRSIRPPPDERRTIFRVPALVRARTGRSACPASQRVAVPGAGRSEEHTSELQSLMRISYAVFCLKKKTT